MDLNLDYSDDESPLSLKSDFILSLCELIVGGKEGLQPVQKTIIDRCVRLVYQTYLNDPRPENMPILEDLYNLLREQEEKEAQYIATALEIYVTGSLNVFNHQSNVDINNRIVCYDIKVISFNNETENGKLYINYPMVEALRDFRTGICGSKENCFVLSEELGKYKFLSIRNVDFPQFKMYDFQVWQAVIEVFSMRLSCLMNQSAVITYNQYVEIVTPLEIFKLEEKEILKNRVFIISAFPEFLLDYFGVKLWKKCAKHTENLLTKQMCRAE